MFYRAFLFFAAFLFPVVSFSHSDNKQGAKTPINYTDASIYVSGGKYGVLDDYGEVLIPPTYDYLEPCTLYDPSDPSYARACKNGKWGILGPDGTEVLPIKYDQIRYRYPFFIVVLDGKWGVVDQDWWERIEPAKYDQIYPFRANRAIVRVGENYGVIDAWGREVAEIKYDKIFRFRGKIFLGGLGDSVYDITPEGKAVPLKTLDASICQDGAYVYIQDKKWGVVDKDGRETVKPVYDAAIPYGNLILVKRGENGWGAIDENGNVIIPLIYSAIRYDDVHSSLYANKDMYYFQYQEALSISKKEGWFVGFRTGGQKDYFDFLGNNIGENGTERIEHLYKQRKNRERYETAGFLIEHNERERSVYLTDANLRPIGREWAHINILHQTTKNDLIFRARAHDNAYYFLGKKGEVLSGPYDYIDEGHLDAWVVKRNDVYEIVDRYGKSVSPIRSALPILPAGGQVFLETIEINKYDQRRYIAKSITGEVLSEKTWGEPSIPWRNGMAWRKIGDRYGAIDRSGTLVIAPQYEGVASFSNGVALVKEHASIPDYKIIRRDGRTVFQVPDGWAPLDNYYSNGMMRFRDTSGNLVFVNRLGETVFSLDSQKYTDSTAVFSSLGLLKVQSAETGLWGFLTKTGHEKYPCQFKELYGFKWDSLHGLYYATAKDEGDEDYYYFDLEGHIIDDFYPLQLVPGPLELAYLIFEEEYFNRQADVTDYEKMLEDYYNSDFDLAERIQNH